MRKALLGVTLALWVAPASHAATRVIYASNWFWFHVFGVPLYREFPVVREGSERRPTPFLRRLERRAALLTCAAVAVLGAVGYAAFEPRWHSGGF